MGQGGYRFLVDVSGEFGVSRPVGFFTVFGPFIP